MRPSTPSSTSARRPPRWGDYTRKRKQGFRQRRVGFPRYKRRKHEQGFRADNGPDTVKVDGKTVVLPKIGRVTVVEHLRFFGRSTRSPSTGRREQVRLLLR